MEGKGWERRTLVWRPFGEMSAGGERVGIYVYVYVYIFEIRSHVAQVVLKLASYVAKENLELQILLSPSSERWDYRHMPPPTPRGMEPRATQALCQLSYTPSA